MSSSNTDQGTQTTQTAREKCTVEACGRMIDVGESYTDFLGSDMVTLVVGRKNKPFCLHKDLLCHRIPYFKSMFSQGWLETSKQSAKFPEDSEESFSILIEWVYTSKIRPLCLIRKEYAEDTKEFTTILSYNCVKLWTLADKLLLPDLKDKTMNAWKDAYQEYQIGRSLTVFTKITEAYKITPENSPSRKFTTQMVAYAITCKDDTEDCRYVAEFFGSNTKIRKEVLQVIKNAQGSVPDPRKSKYCEFHQHPPGENSCPNVENDHVKYMCGG